MHTDTHSPKPFIPPDPDSIKISSADQALIFDWFAGNDPITEIARTHNLSILELSRWAKRPDIAKILQTLKDLHDDRFKLKASVSAYDALTTLHFISATESPSSAQEISRRAAAKIISLAFPDKQATTQGPKVSKGSVPSPAEAPPAEPPTPNLRRVPERSLDRLDPRVKDQHVQFLDSIGSLARNDDLRLAHTQQHPAPAAKQPDGPDSPGPCSINRAHDVRRVPARAQHDQTVTLAPQPLNPAREDLLKPIVIRDAGQMCGISARQGRERGPIPAESPGKLLSKVHRIGHGPAIAADENLLASAQARGQSLRAPRARANGQRIAPEDIERGRGVDKGSINAPSG